MTTANPDITDDDTYNEGDFTIISADNVRFKTQWFILLSARWVWNDPGSAHLTSEFFVDASTVPLAHQDKVVHLTDTTFETAEVLRAFLGIAHNWLLPADFALEHLDPLIRFLKKYDCKRPLVVLYEGLRDRTNETTCDILFVTGMQHDLDTLVDNVCDKMAAQDGDGTVLTFLDMAQRMGQKDTLRLLPKYLWALSQTLAHAACDCTGDLMGGWKDFPGFVYTYEHLMGEQ